MERNKIECSKLTLAAVKAARAGAERKTHDASEETQKDVLLVLR
jgi:hypothetical protein